MGQISSKPAVRNWTGLVTIILISGVAAAFIYRNKVFSEMEAKEEGEQSPATLRAIAALNDDIISRVSVCESQNPLDYDIEAAMDISNPRSLIDTHCHLDFISNRMFFSHGQRLNTFKEFKFKHRSTFPKSYEGCIAVFCEPSKWLKFGVEDALRHDKDVWMTFGVHPHYANDFDTEAYLALDRLLDRPQVVGLGEIGLDYSAKNNVDRTIQKRTFDNQLRLAMEKKLPVCLHIRDADVDALAVLDEAGLPLDYKIHLHCFTSSWEQCLVWLNKYPNLKVGFTPLITKTSVRHLHKVIQKVPLDRILLETDAPYFLPRQMPDHQHDLSFSHPGFVIHTAAQVANLKGVPVEEVIEANRRNLCQVYSRIPCAPERAKFASDPPQDKYRSGNDVVSEELFEEISDDDDDDDPY